MNILFSSQCIKKCLYFKIPKESSIMYKSSNQILEHIKQANIPVVLYIYKKSIKSSLTLYESLVDYRESEFQRISSMNDMNELNRADQLFEIIKYEPCDLKETRNSFNMNKIPGLFIYFYNNLITRKIIRT